MSESWRQFSIGERAISVGLPSSASGKARCLTEATLAPAALVRACRQKCWASSSVAPRHMRSPGANAFPSGTSANDDR